MGAGIRRAHASGRVGQQFDEKKVVDVRFDIIQV